MAVLTSYDDAGPAAEVHTSLQQRSDLSEARGAIVGNLRGEEMKTATYGTKQVHCYQESDLQSADFLQTCEFARELWSKRCEEYVKEHGDKGSAVIGAGFAVWYLPPRARKPQRKTILRPPTGAQGSLVWETSKDEVEKLFIDAAIDVEYEWGVMD